MKTKINKLIFDDKNCNKGTEDGKKLLHKSLMQFGAGRSILVDKNNRIIAGNKTTEAFAGVGGKDVEIIESDGSSLVVVRRTDIDLDSKEGRELAIADNATSSVNVLWDENVIDEIESIYGDVREDWGIDRIEHESKGEIDLDDLDETQTLKIVLSAKDYEYAIGILSDVDSDIKKAFLKILGYEE